MPRMFTPLLLLAGITTVTTADLITVDDDGNAQYSTIQAAINAAGQGDVILVAPGTYTAAGASVVNPNGKSIRIRSIKGPEVTFIDGEGIRTGIRCDSEEDNTTIIEGFTITNCSASWYDWNDNDQIDYWEYFGGGMWNRDGSSPTVRDCIFSNNRAEYGGGMYNGDENGVNASPVIESCSFIENGKPNGVGGGMYNNASTPELSDCMFQGNFSDFGGAICNFSNSAGTLTGCTFIDNRADDDGGAIYNSNSEPTATNCVFTENTAGDEGGAVFNADQGSSANIPVFIECTMSGNACGGEGGGMHNFSVSPVISNCTITDNSGSTGGGIYSWNSSNPNIDGTDVCGNSPNQIGGNWTDNGGNLVDENCDGTPCPTDLNGDGITDGADLGIFFVSWNACGNCPADLNNDGNVDGQDLGLLFVGWGPCE